MIIAMKGTVRIDGDRDDVLAEATVILHNVHLELLKRYGKEEADEQIALISQLAVMNDMELEDLARPDTTGAKIM